MSLGTSDAWLLPSSLGPPSSVSNVIYDSASTTLSWTPPSDVLITSLLLYQVIVSSRTTGQTLLNNITKETRITLPLTESCGSSSYLIQVHTMCEVLMGASAQLSYDQSKERARVMGVAKLL